MTSDADLEAIWTAFRKNPAELYKLVALFTACSRLHAEAILAAARRAPAAEEHPARVGEPAEGRGEFLGSFGFRTGRLGGLRCPKCGVADVVCSHPECPPHFDPTGTDPAPQILHTYGPDEVPPGLREACSHRRTHMLDTGPPRDPAAEQGDVA